MDPISTEQLLAYFLETRAISTDSRSIPPRAIFFGIRGDRFNGNAYAAGALEKGASLVVVDDEQYYLETDSRYIWVTDTLYAIQQLAYAYRMLFDIPVLGITGSNGKTTTKELILSVLQTEKRVHATQGNFNNHLGVPLTLLAMPQDTEIALIEMGANQPGDIADLCEIAAPTLGLITNIGAAHLEKLISLRGVQETKGALFRYVNQHNGKIFCNLSDPMVVEIAQHVPWAASYGTPEADYYVEVLKDSLDGLELDAYLKGDEYKGLESSLSGSYNALNITAALVVGHYFGLSISSLQAGIQSYVPSNNRSQIHSQRGHSFWMDAYNANPSSMKAAISHLCNTTNPNDLVLVLGDMLELGPEEEQAHRDLGDFINTFSPALTLGIGPKMKHLVEQVSSPAKWYPSTQEVKASFWQEIEGKKWILLKGSRGMKLEELLD
ncbi:MAG: UDP-N-acetylmuramoyl-tripeptide--D-alanyl-D-alanine ligase [Bacteroidota bacterium]